MMQDDWPFGEIAGVVKQSCLSHKMFVLGSAKEKGEV